ncbi:MAG: tripartite tricarboxylate transporter TctB family protein [Deltaproteobacteria bacterium]|nr:tripartite tricarboxylate transporter TctB family protein [Deltaproteobacteria bacterium]
MLKSRGDIPGIAFGGFLIFLAIVALTETWNLATGTAEDMGPGYVPRALSFIIMAFGLVIAGRSLIAGRRPLPAIKLRPILSVLLSLAVFALLLPRGGLALATLATMACSTFATADFKWRESLIFAVIITAFTVLLFVYGLGLPLSVWPRW